MLFYSNEIVHKFSSLNAKLVHRCIRTLALSLKLSIIQFILYSFQHYIIPSLYQSLSHYIILSLYDFILVAIDFNIPLEYKLYTIHHQYTLSLYSVITL